MSTHTILITRYCRLMPGGGEFEVAFTCEAEVIPPDEINVFVNHIVLVGGDPTRELNPGDFCDWEAVCLDFAEELFEKTLRAGLH